MVKTFISTKGGDCFSLNRKVRLCVYCCRGTMATYLSCVTLLYSPQSYSNGKKKQNGPNIKKLSSTIKKRENRIEVREEEEKWEQSEWKGKNILAKESTGQDKYKGGRGEEQKWSETDSHDSDRRKSVCDAEPQDPLTLDPSSLTAPDPSSISVGSPPPLPLLPQRERQRGWTRQKKLSQFLLRPYTSQSLNKIRTLKGCFSGS